ncbi:MAG: AMP-binding protein [Schaalia hyovaginalis]|nr:AMP-binding protein [Schaalia hyovaginalis]MCI7513865.1 AMP-binding protein [Schaalia hyovaginalis]
MAPDYSPARALLRAAKQHPDRRSIIWPGPQDPWTVGRSADVVSRTVSALRDLGVAEGDRVVFAAANSAWVFLVHVACAWIGAVTVPVSERLPLDVIEGIIDSIRPRLVLSDPDSALAERRGMRVLDLDAFASLSLASAPAQDAPRALGSEPAAIVYTSGSAGRTRGVELSHAQLWWGSMCFRDGFEYAPYEEVVGVCAPVSHIGGFNGTSLDVFSHGGAIRVFPAFDPVEVLSSIEADRITMMFVVPVMCHLLLDANASLGADLSSWHRPLVGGDAMGPALARRLRSAGLRPIHVWGMTETAGAGMMASPDSAAPAGALGAPFPYVDARLVLADGTPAKPGEIGEIEVRGPGVATTFISAGERGPARVRDGWLATGDLATRDEEGWYTIVGRASRMINTGGELVAPARLEELIRGLDGVDDVIVVGVPDERWGQVVSALLVDRSGLRSGSARATVAVLDHRLAPWERIRKASWVEALPQLPNGKPDARAAERMLTGAE